MKWLNYIMYFSFLLLYNISVLHGHTTSQPKIQATSTGQTTGHIGNLRIQNDAQEPFLLSLGPLFIPSSGAHQSYVVPKPLQVEIPPRSTHIVPIHGYCADVFTPPVPTNERLPPIDTWVQKVEDLYDLQGLIPEKYLASVGISTFPIPSQIATGQGVILIPFNEVIPDPSGHVQLWKHLPQGTGTIDVISNHFRENRQSIPEVFPVLIPTDKTVSVIAPLIIDATEKIIHVTRQLQESGQMSTPFSNNPEKEFQTVVQHTIWMYTSVLSGKEYEFEDFREKLTEQFTETTGIKEKEIPAEIKEELNHGAFNFWEKFNLVGAEAKVIKKIEPVGESSPEMDPFPTSAPGETDPPCICGAVTVLHDGLVYALDDFIADENSELITGDSISSLTSYLRYDPPEVQVDCPEHCRLNIQYSHKMIIKRPFYVQRTTQWQKGPITLGIDGLPAVIEFETRVIAECESERCLERIFRRKIHVVEKNSCCDEIRNKNNGKLSFAVNGHEAIIQGYTLSIYGPGGSSEHIHFGFNIESIFCNLGENQIFAELLSAAGVSGGSEAHSVRDISMGYNTDIDGSRPYYNFGVSRSINGREFQLIFSMDAETCIVDISLFRDGRMFETLGMPSLSLGGLQDLINQLRERSGASYFNHALNIIFQLIKHEHYQTPPSRGTSRSQVKNSLISNIRTHIQNLIKNNPGHEDMHKWQSLVNALASGDLSQIAMAMIGLSGG